MIGQSRFCRVYMRGEVERFGKDGQLRDGNREGTTEV